MDDIQDGFGYQALDTNELIERLQYSVKSGCSVSPGTNDMTVQVAAGDVFYNGSSVSVAAQDNVALDAADADNPRKDVVYVDSSGSLQVAAGTPEAPTPTGDSRRQTQRPAPPDLSTVDGVVLAEVWIPAAAADITSTDVSDRRLFADAVFAALTADDVTAANSLTDPAGTQHTGELADASDLHARYTDEEAQDAVNTLLAGGDKVSTTYDDANNTLTIDTSALDTEEVEDAVASLLTATSNTTVTYDDANATLTVGLASQISGSDISTPNLSITQGRGLLGLPNHHINYESGLSNEEVARFTLDSGDVLEVWRLESTVKGGGTNSNVTIDIYDATNGSVLASTTAGSRSEGGGNPLGTSGAGATILVRVSTGSNAVNVCTTGVTSVVSQ